MAPPMGRFFLSLLDARRGGEGSEGEGTWGKTDQDLGGGLPFYSPPSPLPPPCSPSPPHPVLSRPAPPGCPSPPSGDLSPLGSSPCTSEEGPLSSAIDAPLCLLSPPLPTSPPQPYSPSDILILYLLIFLLPASPQHMVSSHQTP